MKKMSILAGLAILLVATTTAFGQNNLWITPCDPCNPNPCDPCGGRVTSPFTFGGWVESGVYTNSHGSRSNGPMHTASRERTDFVMSQLYLFTEREMDTRRGFDWGARADFVYGVDCSSKQTFGDGTFDYGWGNNRHGYGMSAYQLYGTVGYRDFSVKAGKFYGLVGWEASASLPNFFYSHSYNYWIEPATHMGVIATQNLGDRLSITGGWVTGENSSFKNPYDSNAFLGGFTFALANDANVHYYINAGRQGHDAETRFNYFVQSVVFEWDVSDRFSYVMQYNLRNDNERGDDGRFSSYGINNHFLYTISDHWKAGVRVEWLRDNGGFGYITEDAADFYNVTFGLNWNPRKNLSIRPEIRYDWCRGGASPFGDERRHQFSGGGGLVLSF